MGADRRLAFGYLIAWMSLAAAAPCLGAEPTEDTRTLARMFAALEAHDQKAYCESKLAAPYADYLSRVCQSAVQNKVKASEDCSREALAEQARKDASQCLAVSGAEFAATVAKGKEGRKAFVTEMKAQGIDGEALIKQASAKRP